MDGLLQDVRIAVRGLLRRRTFGLVAIATLAVGVGATTAIFSIVDAVLLRPLPYRDPSRLYRVWQAFPEWQTNEVMKARWDRVGLSYPQFLAIAALSEVVESATVFAPSDGNFVATGVAERVRVGRTTAMMLSTLGLRPVVGRDLSAADESGQGGAAVLLGYEFWRRHFGANPSVVGQAVSIDGQPALVIGVAPEELRLLSAKNANDESQYIVPDAWVPIGRESGNAAGRAGHMYQGIVRLRPGIDPRAAESLVVPLLGRVLSTYRPSARTPGGSLEPLGRHETRNSRAALWILLAASGLVLLVACGNVANLMLSEVAPRTRELALRSTLGAGRGRLARMLLTESLVLALAGGALGVGVAAWSLDGLVALAPIGVLPNIGAVRLDLRVLCFSLVVSGGTGVLFGLVPAFVAGRTDLLRGLKEGQPTGGRSAGVLQRVVLAAQVALAVVVLVSGVLLVRSLILLTRVDPGFDRARLLTVGLRLPPDRYSTEAARKAFYEALRERIAAIPAVKAFTQTSAAPFRLEGFTSNPISVASTQRSLETERRLVLANYFDVLGFRVVEGEPVRDDLTCRVWLNRAAVTRLFAGRGAIGAQLSQVFGPAKGPCVVAGIVEDIKERALDADSLPTYYRVIGDGDLGTATLLLRTDRVPESLIPAVRKAISSVDPQVPLIDPASMETLVERTVSAERYRAIPMALFGLATALLAAIGTYGVMAHVVARQTRALGIRLALGARPQQVVRLVLRYALAITGAGVVIGIGCALAASRVFAAALFGVRPTDAWTYTGVALAVSLLMLLAGWLPARRTAALDPSAVLRAE